MNTPAHVILNLLALGRTDTPPVLTPVIVGGLLPDVPIFIFYFVEKMILGTPERLIWREAYYQPGWQNFIDVFNSLPFMLILLGVAWWARSPIGIRLSLSLMLHVAGDLPLHHDDGHRHLFPLTDWRFASPVSYWDPNHYGDLVTLIEILAVVIGATLLYQNYRSRVGKGAIAIVGSAYLGYFVYALLVWS